MTVIAPNPFRKLSPQNEDVVPLLENGDRLTRDEFERRYHAMPEVKKAELIEGVVYMPSPVRIRKHGVPHVDLVTWVGVYEAATPGVLAGDSATARLDLDNEPQPDVLLMIDPAKGGQARISEDDYIEGAPELVCEVAASSASIDLHAKLNAYRRNGVKEYLVWVIAERAIYWHVLVAGQFEKQTPGPDGLLRSAVFPGLTLDPAALLEGNMARVLEVLQTGLKSAEHEALVRKLNPAQ